MGKVLEMTRVAGFTLAVAMLLSACGSPLVKVALARATGPQASAVALPAKDSPQIMMTMVSRGIKFPLHQLDSQGDVTLWAAADGAQVALRGGQLISTRGFGMDLMSAAVPSVASLIAGGSYDRTHHYLDGADTPIRTTFTCSAAVAEMDPKMPKAVHYQETCRSKIGKVVNDYWVSGGARVVKARQWATPALGYAIFDTGGQ
jgi:Group 4 capsule polysaccharide lipoprotein gfcB, YjbF